MSAHDRWLANYHRGTVQVWCSNKTCANHADGMEVDWESEYGQSSYVTYEECPLCHGEWLEDPPDDDEDDWRCKGCNGMRSALCHDCEAAHRERYSEATEADLSDN